MINNESTSTGRFPIALPTRAVLQDITSRLANGTTIEHILNDYGVGNSRVYYPAYMQHNNNIAYIGRRILQMRETYNKEAGIYSMLHKLGLSAAEGLLNSGFVNNNLNGGRTVLFMNNDRMQVNSSQMPPWLPITIRLFRRSRRGLLLRKYYYSKTEYDLLKTTMEILFEKKQNKESGFSISVTKFILVGLERMDGELIYDLINDLSENIDKNLIEHTYI